MARRKTRPAARAPRSAQLPSWVIPAGVLVGGGALAYFLTRPRGSASSTGLEALLGGGGGVTPGRGGSGGGATPGGTGGPTGGATGVAPDTTPKPPSTGGAPPLATVSSALQGVQGMLAQTDCPFPVRRTGVWDDDTRMAAMWALTQMNDGNTARAAERIHALDADHGVVAITAFARELCYVTSILALGATYSC